MGEGQEEFMDSAAEDVMKEVALCTVQEVFRPVVLL